jgi:hypothetical protein
MRRGKIRESDRQGEPTIKTEMRSAKAPATGDIAFLNRRLRRWADQKKMLQWSIMPTSSLALSFTRRLQVPSSDSLDRFSL